MKRAASMLVAALAVSVPSLVAQSSRNATTATVTSPTIEQLLTPGYPSELVSARKADRIAWIAYERGQRNVYAAAAPGFAPVRLTRFLDDNGVDISDLDISDDGTVVTFVRGTVPNREGWVANQPAIRKARIARSGPRDRLTRATHGRAPPDRRASGLRGQHSPALAASVGGVALPGAAGRGRAAAGRGRAAARRSHPYMSW
jgi:hypothetical protein